MWQKKSFVAILLASIALLSSFSGRGNCFAQQIPPAAPSSSDDQATKAATAKKIAAYQKNLDESDWSFDVERSEITYCIRLCRNAVNFRLETREGFPPLKISLIVDGKSVYSWEGHFTSVFCVSKDRLFYVENSGHVTGGSVVAVDLKSGKEIWRSHLKAIGNVGHSTYFVYHNISMVGDDVIISGRESLGRYMEIKSGETGETLANRIYESPILEN